eukprot:Sdes_comp21141_c0_seq1m19813
MLPRVLSDFENRFSQWNQSLLILAMVFHPGFRLCEFSHLITEFVVLDFIKEYFLAWFPHRDFYSAKWSEYFLWDKQPRADISNPFHSQCFSHLQNSPDAIFLYWTFVRNHKNPQFSIVGEFACRIFSILISPSFFPHSPQNLNQISFLASSFFPDLSQNSSPSSDSLLSLRKSLQILLNPPPTSSDPSLFSSSSSNPVNLTHFSPPVSSTLSNSDENPEFSHFPSLNTLRKILHSSCLNCEKTAGENSPNSKFRLLFSQLFFFGEETTSS